MPGLTLPSSGSKEAVHAGMPSNGSPVVRLLITCLEHSPRSMAFLDLLGTIPNMSGILTPMASGGHLGQD